MTRLITTPTFTFDQSNGENLTEGPVQVTFYQNDDKPMITLTQEGREINFSNLDNLVALTKEAKKHYAEATRRL